MVNPEELSQNQAIDLVVRRTVDQAVVDGEVDGIDRRIAYNKLARIAFKGVMVPVDTRYQFKIGLKNEERFIDIVSQQYGFEALLDPASEARPSLRALVAGTAIATMQERSNALMFMDHLACLVYEKAVFKSARVSVREISGALKAAGMGVLSYEEWGGFLEYMAQDPRFYPIGDGSYILTDKFNGDMEDITPALPISRSEMPGVIEAALPLIFASSQNTFPIGALLGTLKSQGIYIRQEQIQTLAEQLSLLPSIELLETGWFKWHKPESQYGEPVRQKSLEEMIRDLRGGIERKPRGKKGYKRTVQF